MSKIGLVVLLSILTGRTVAQNYFVFIGSDNRQPFYVRLDSQFYTSTPGGHLLLAPLEDSDYTMTVGFPDQVYPEERYAFSIHRKDQEFQLKKQDDGSWRLYDVQTKNWMTAQQKAVEPSDTRVAGIKKDDAFSRMMAGVVHDTAVLYNTFAMQQALDDSAAAKASLPSDTSAALGKGRRSGSDSVSSTVSAAVPGPDSTLSSVVKLSEKRSSRSLRQVYTDAASGRQTDTIVVIIPIDTIAKDRHPAVSQAPAADTADAKDRRPAVNPAADTSIAKVRRSVSPLAADTLLRSATAIPYINSDCHNFATDYDIDRLRVKMLEATKDEDRIVIARKVFKTKCFYTNQLRALSEVFTTDAAKYRFFEAAWPYAGDEHFHELSLLLTDPLYIGKFRTMTGARP